MTMGSPEEIVGGKNHPSCRFVPTRGAYYNQSSDPSLDRSPESIRSLESYLAKFAIGEALS